MANISSPNISFWRRTKKLLKLSHSASPDSQQRSSDTAAYTLELVLYSLPELGKLAGELSEAVGIREPRYDLLSRIETVAFLLESQLSSVTTDNVGNGNHRWTDTELCHAANVLEGALARKTESTPPRQHEPSSGATSWRRRLFHVKGSKKRGNTIQHPPSRYPRLAEIKASGHSDEDKKSMHQRLYDDLASFTFQDLELLLEQFEKCTTKAVSVSVPDELLSPQDDALLDHELPEMAFREFVADAFSAIVCSSDCLETPNREVHLNLAAYNSQNQGTSELGYLSLVAEYHHGNRKDWREIALHAEANTQPSRNDRTVKFADTSDAESTVSVIKWPIEEPIGCLCDCIRLYHERPTEWCFNLELHGSHLTRFWLDPRKRYMPEDTRDQITLRSLVSSRRHNLSLSTKMSLSLMLAYSLFYLYSEPWVDRIWDRDNVLLAPNVGGLHPPQPFLRVVSWTAKGKRGVKQSLISPQLLELGVMLLEIHFGQSLEQILESSSPISTIPDLQASASQVFNDAIRKGSLQERRGLRRALRICLSQGVKVTGQKGTTASVEVGDIQRAMFKDVVKPLEQDLENAGFKSSSEPSTESGGPGDLGDSGMNTRAINSIQLRSEPISRKNSSVHLAEAGVSNSTAAATASQESAITDKWMLDFSGIADSRTSRNAPIIKIAVLDTGIDREHQDFLDDERIKDWQSWTGSPADTDSNGHGTHVVSTLLQLAGQNVEIYVAKISDDIKLHSGQADKIAEAIDHSTQTWDVDIISMSFGFGEKFESIQKAIDRAVDTQKIVFAAASNEGANRTRTFPATHPRVICVHSADGYGNPSKFNPTALQWKHNFCVLGEHIEAACPRSNEDDFGGVKRESGTSFATPVGVAIAAFLICYVAEKRPDSKSWKTPVKSPDGVMAMFEEMSENRGVGLYSSINIINVFNDSAAGEEEFLAKIRKRLEKR